jgi:predicted transcriptional regulator
LLLVVPSVAASQGVEFSVPAELDGAAVVDGLTRVLVIVPPNGGHVGLELADAAGTATNRTYTLASSHQPTIGRFDAPVPSSESSAPVSGLRGILADGSEAASIYIEGDLRLAFTGRASLAGKPDGQGFEAFLGPGGAEGDFVRPRHLPDREPYVLAPTGALGSFTIEASRVTRMEWFGVQVACAAACPDGGGLSSTQAPLPLDWTLTQQTFSFHEFDTATALHGSGQGAYVLAGGPAPSVSLAGQARLPLATAAPCAGCVQAAGETISTSGNTTLQGIHDLGGDRMQAGLGVDGAVRVDEAPFVAFGTGATVAAGAVAVAVVVLAWKLAAALLFSRHVKGPLNHPRRAKLHEVVVANPGATFRTVAAKAGLAPGVARHHLTVLARAGLVVARPHKSTVRYFENHGKYDAGWRDLVVLREPEMRALHDWLDRNPGAPQGAIAAEMQARHGWSRSTTQNRLAKLVEAKLATARREGRTVHYASLRPA